MDRLILFRHGKAERDSASGRDFDRRLAPRGVKEAAAQARVLADMGLSPDLVLVSPAARTRETWEAAAPAFAAPELRYERGLYNAEADNVRAVVETAADAPGVVMVVGHNPGLQDLAVELLKEGSAPRELVDQVARRFPTSVAVVFLIDSGGRPTFDGFMLPDRSDA
jgi:phosphohistidine phosphatase